MNIVMFTDAYWPRVNGVSVAVESFSMALIRAGHRVMVVCSVYPETLSEEFKFFTGEVEDNGAENPLLVRVPSMSVKLFSKEDRLAKFSGWFWVAKHIDSFKPDIIHIHSEMVIAEFGFYYARLHYIPVVYTFHTLWEDYGFSYFPLVPDRISRFIIRRVHKSIIKRAEIVLVPTVQIRDVVRRYRVRRETVLLPTGIDQRLFRHTEEEVDTYRRNMETRFPALKGKRILLFAGRVTKEKNLSFLLKICPDIFKQFDDAVLMMAGNGPDLEDLKKEAADLGVAERCIFSGYLERHDLVLTYAMSYLFVFPSCTETQGLVTIEAMLSGIPVVAIGEMGTIQVMNGDNGGFMVKNDPAEFTDRVCRLLADKNLYAQKVADAREHAKGWTIDTSAAKLEKVYQGVLAGWPGKPGTAAEARKQR